MSSIMLHLALISFLFSASGSDRVDKKNFVSIENAIEQAQSDLCLTTEQRKEKIEKLKAERIIPSCLIQGQPLSPWYLVNFSEGTTLGERYTALKQSIFSKSNPELNFDLRQKPKNLLEIVQIASMTPFGASKVKNLISPFVKGEIQVKFTSGDEIKKASYSSDDIWGAYYDSDKKTLYLNKDAELGVVVPYFIHELEHALDKEYAESHCCPV